MKKLTPQQKEKIATALRSRNAILDCPRCHCPNFTISDGYFVQSIQTEIIGTVIGGPSIPSIALICNRCGFISQHALGALRLLPNKIEKDER